MRGVLFSVAAMAAGFGTANAQEPFKIESADAKLKGQSGNRAQALAVTPGAQFGAIAAFKGTFTGKGLNTIFRPNNNVAGKGTTFNNPVSPPPGTGASENVLEINLTNETLEFQDDIGNVPNRGLFSQGDITLNGVPYLQKISDIANVNTGKADGDVIPIHFEPGLWMHVEATNNNPVIGESLMRMGSIPHGTVINAQSLNPSSSINGPPTIPAADITPFVVGSPSSKFRFNAQNASRTDTPRLPQDLTKFIAAGTITQAILDDPNTVLRASNKGKNITSFTTFTVSTAPVSPFRAGGTANMDFLAGTNDKEPKGPNALAPSMNATFWIENLSWKITVPAMKQGTTQNVKPAAPSPGIDVPTFAVTAPKDINAPTNITVSSVQIQYSQNVLLNFNGLSWPHVSVNTLFPLAPIAVPSSAFS